MTLDEILIEINKAETIVISAHESPDGDAVGSCMAMKLILEQMGKSPDVILPEYSSVFNYLPEIDEVKKESNIKNYDLAISLDCANLSRLVRKEYFENAKKTIVIDHHGSNNMYGDLNFVNPVSPACCEVIAEMLEYYQMNITKDIGTCIITGIITDTGGFRHPSITAETFDFTAELIRKGVNVSSIYKKALRTQTKANFLLVKKAMERMEVLENGKVTYTYITLDDLKEVNAGPGDHEGLVDLGRDLEGVEVSLFIREKEKNVQKISLRTGDSVNASDVCYAFGGGGHTRAAGATIQGTLEEAKEKILKEIRKSL